LKDRLAHDFEETAAPKKYWIELHANGELIGQRPFYVSAPFAAAFAPEQRRLPRVIDAVDLS
jgi:hypothetical protein